MDENYKEPLHVGHKINKLSHKIRRKINAKLYKYGLTDVQGKILGYILREGSKRNIYQKDLEEIFEIRRSSITSVISLLERKGYIKRVSVSEDARLKKLELTKEGKKINSEVYETIIEIEDTIKNEFTENELKLFLNFLDRIDNGLKD